MLCIRYKHQDLFEKIFDHWFKICKNDMQIIEWFDQKQKFITIINMLEEKFVIDEYTWEKEIEYTDYV